MKLEKYKEAVDHFAEAQEMRKNIIGEENLDSAENYFELGYVYGKLG